MAHMAGRGAEKQIAKEAVSVGAHGQQVAALVLHPLDDFLGRVLAAEGDGLGAELLVHALTTIVSAARLAGGRMVVVDAIDDDAAGFYRAHDFQPSPTNPHRLVLKLSTAARALGLTWP